MWRDMDIVLNKAKVLGMNVWVLDDKHYPTGFANEKILEHPELTQWHIAERNVDIIGGKTEKFVSGRCRKINCYLRLRIYIKGRRSITVIMSF